MSTVTEKLLECEYCGTELDEEQSSNPYKDGTGSIMCDDCHHEHYEFTCMLCEEYAPTEDQDKILVIREECGGLSVGIYQILRLPYFTSNYFSMWWMKERFEYIGPLNPDHNFDDYYPSGHLCAECQLRVMPPRNFGNPENCFAPPEPAQEPK